MLLNVLKRAKEDGHILSIYTDKENTEKFSAGYIQQISEDLVLISHVTPYGLYDGYMIRRIEDIYRLECHGKYEKKLETLYNIQNQNHKKIPHGCGTIFEDLFKFSLDNHLVINIQLHYSELEDIQGYVDEFFEDSLIVRQLDDEGNDDGETVISISDITLLTCDSDREMALRLLST